MEVDKFASCIEYVLGNIWPTQRVLSGRLQNREPSLPPLWWPEQVVRVMSMSIA